MALPQSRNSAFSRESCKCLWLLKLNYSFPCTINIIIPKFLKKIDFMKKSPCRRSLKKGRKTTALTGMGDISLLRKSLSVICTTDLTPLLFIYVQCSVWKWLISAPLIFGPDLQPSTWQVLILPSSGACVCIIWVSRLDACLKCGL